MVGSGLIFLEGSAFFISSPYTPVLLDF